MFFVYADESCKDNHQFLILGGICIEQKYINEITQRFYDIRNRHNTFGEVKWGKVSKTKYDFYVDYVNLFFEYCSKDIAHFHYLSINTSTLDHKTYNQGNSEIGFDKLIFQLLFHKFGKKYGANKKIQVYLDERTTKNDPNKMTAMLNGKLKKECGLQDPFTRITFQDSKTSEILQVNDLIIGAIGFRANSRHLDKNSAKHKVDFSDMLLTKAEALESPVKMSSAKARLFTSWDFAFKRVLVA